MLDVFIGKQHVFSMSKSLRYDSFRLFLLLKANLITHPVSILSRRVIVAPVKSVQVVVQKKCHLGSEKELKVAQVHHFDDADTKLLHDCNALK